MVAAVGKLGTRRGTPGRKRGPGPWGEAIRYWLDKLDRSQADLVHALNTARRERNRAMHGRGPLRLIQPKTISMIARGFHTQTRLLAEIADALHVPIAEILVRPRTGATPEQWRELFPGVYTGTPRDELAHMAGRLAEVETFVATFDKFLQYIRTDRAALTREASVEDVAAQIAALTPPPTPSRRRKRGGATSAA